MKVLQPLPDVLYDYLVHVVQKHAGSGIHPEEGHAVAHLWEAVTKNVTHLDDAQIRAAAAAATPQGQSPVSAPETEPDLIEGPKSAQSETYGHGVSTNG
jgi:hypothetical protein